jgi:hypothetical protein
MAKGPQFERDISRQLSLWWSHEERDDLIWRTSNSGGRSTVRSKKGLRTAGHSGDLTYTDPVAKPLFDFLTWELKCGYPHANIQQLIDKPARAAEQTYEKWIKQAEASAKKSGSRTWCIVHKKNGRDAVILLPETFPAEWYSRLHPVGKINLEDRCFIWAKLDTFLECIDPRWVCGQVT